ncbi:HipA family kinase [Herbaspirillum sp. C9C3]|uniref:HipA family kinase n=1 Tax=Herbaspirillum sp. C9C3 TaxID=2735271 RepID=UPI00201BFF9D|nr:HipA family kinase [Herbaspirillum sp. C9C3]
MVNIIEILDRSTQGMTRPFLCKDELGRLFYVKGRNAARRGLIAEWLCARLATAFGLPVAPYAIVHVPEPLIEAASDPEIRELGEGVAFGSQRVPNVLEISWMQAQRVPQWLRRDILVFDWWVRNDDRNLTQLGGNPNLLWDTSRAQLVVIDHNAAFSMDFSASDFLQTHIFAAEWVGIVEDWIHRSHYQQRLANAYAMWEEALASCPPSWFWADFGVPAQFDPEAVGLALRRFDQPDFWDLAP